METKMLPHICFDSHWSIYDFKYLFSSVSYIHTYMGIHGLMVFVFLTFIGPEKKSFLPVRPTVQYYSLAHDDILAFYLSVW